jgi:hypothetical protein
MRNVDAIVEIAVSPDKVISAFTEPSWLKAWWGVEKTLIELKQGGIYTLAWGISGAGIKYVSTGIIKEYYPRQLLHIEKYIYLNTGKAFLGPQELIIQVAGTDQSSKLFLTQGPYPEIADTDWNWFYEAVVEEKFTH